MSWISCCFRCEALTKEGAIIERPCTSGDVKAAPPYQAATSNSLACRASSEACVEDSPPRPLVHAASSRVPKASQKGLRLSEDTVASALSTTPTSLNPLSYFLPFASDEHDGFSAGHVQEDVDNMGHAAPQQTRSKVDFADLCGSLEDLVYIGEGSNGVVYSASWHGARVAVKFLLGNNDDSVHRQRCFTEAVLTRVLSHPCVVQCFATAIAQLTPEVWEAIRARCRRHQSILQSSSLGRSVAAAVLQQVEQEQHQLQTHPQQQQLQQPQQECCTEQELQQLPAHLQMLPHLATLRRAHTAQQHASPRNSLHRQHTHQPASQHAGALPGAQPHSQPRQPPPPQPCAARSHSNPTQPQLQLPTPSQEPARAYRCSSELGTGAPDSDRLLLEMRKVETFFAEDAELEGEGDLCLGLSGEGMGNRSVDCSTEGMRGGSGGVGNGGEGIGLLQALLDLKAEVGRHCTVVVMEYMDAGTLHQAIVRGEFSARRCLEHRSKLLSLLLTAQELAQGMAHLHGLDILHGDLKPTNVLLKGSPCQYAGAPAGFGSGVGPTCTDPRGYTTKIADLGLARPCTEETAALSSDQWGALAYLAPEAAKGSCCKASDVYSFGVMLWEMAAGVRPYLGLTTPQVLMGLVTGTLQLTWPSDGSLYTPLRSLAIACTDLNPSERPSFEVAARILGRMVRHIRSASEPLRQRHSSALSMEAGGGLPSCSGGYGGATSPAKCLPLQHASRSMPLSGLYNGSTGTGAGTGSAMTAAGAATAAAAAAAANVWQPLARPLSGAAAIGAGSSPPLSSPAQRSTPTDGMPWSATALPSTLSGIAAPHLSSQGSQSWGSVKPPSSPFFPGSGSCMAPGQPLRTAISGGCFAGGSSGAPPGRGPSAAAMAWGPVGECSLGAMGSPPQQHPQPHPQMVTSRLRRGIGGNICGAPIRSPLGGVTSLRALPSAPADPEMSDWSGQPPPLMVGRPESSPAHTHVS